MDSSINILDNSKSDRSSLAIKRLRPMIDTLNAMINHRRISPNLHRHSRISHQQSAEKDFILLDRIRIHGGLALIRVVAENATGGSAGCGGEAIPVLHLIAGDGKGTSFVFGDIVGEEVAEAFMRHVVHVDAGTGGDLTGAVNGPDVVGFAEIVPGDDSRCKKFSHVAM